MNKLTWKEFIRRVDPKGEAGMTVKKFTNMVLHFMVLNHKQKVPPKHN